MSISYVDISEGPVRIDQHRGFVIGERPIARVNLTCATNPIAQLEMNLVIDVNATVRHVVYY